MKIDQEKSEFLDEMLSHWKDEHLLTEDQIRQLKNSYEAKSFDWRRLAQYSFWIAMACGVISLGALLIDKEILNYLKRLYDTPDSIISLLSAVAAAFLYYYSFKRRKTHTRQVFSNDALIFSAVMLTANAIAYLGKAIGHGNSHFSLLILFSVFVYGLVITASSRLLKNNKKFSFFYETSYICGMIYLFVSLWLLSVFGNFATIEEWAVVKQIHLFYWAIISAAACGICILIGLKTRDVVAREFGITFLFLNLYTRYFEYFWDSWHKALFFSVLAASFWLIGQRAEKIWNLEFLKK
jgi:hypothetical protein